MSEAILILNAGSSTDKCLLFEVNPKTHSINPDPIWKGLLDWSIAEQEDAMQVSAKSKTVIKKAIPSKDRGESLKALIESAWEGDSKVIRSPDSVKAVGHRVVHGGDHFQQPVLVTPQVKEAIRSLFPLAPLHNPPQLEGIKILEQLFPRTPQAAMFDTAFHAKIPEKAAVYPGPLAWRKEGIKRYGFHGISHGYCSARAAKLMQKDLSQLKLVICHLGNGCSLAAVQNGQSIDTSMGFTPLEGLMMGTRCGSIDPGILLYLISQKGIKTDELERCLNYESGLRGISGGENDMRKILEKTHQNDTRAKLAFDMFIHRLKYHLCGMLGILGGADAIVFTAGIGENSPIVRAKACEGLDFLGLSIDPSLNEKCSPDQSITSVHSKAKVYVIHTREELAIAQAALQLIYRT